jgi:hypothetical protein
MQKSYWFSAAGNIFDEQIVISYPAPVSYHRNGKYIKKTVLLFRAVFQRGMRRWLFL